MAAGIFKTNNKERKNEPKKEYFKIINSEFNKIVEKIAENTVIFEEEEAFCEDNYYFVEKIIDSIDNFISKYNRIPYSVITQFIFSLDEEPLDTFTNKISMCINFLIDKVNEDEDTNSDSLLNDKKLLDIFIKIMDHVNLASRQYEMYTQTEEGVLRRVEYKLIEIENKAKEKITTERDNLTNQLLSIVGIFTALAFLVFGGIGYLNNIFSSVGHVPLLDLLITGCIWGFCMMNMLFLFMYFIAKLVGKSIDKYHSDTSRTYTIVQKYPFMFFSNWLVVSIFIFSSWLKVIDLTDSGKLIYDILSWNYSCIAGSGILIFLIVASGIKLYIDTKVEDENNN